MEHIRLQQIFQPMFLYFFLIEKLVTFPDLIFPRVLMTSSFMRMNNVGMSTLDNFTSFFSRKLSGYCSRRADSEAVKDLQKILAMYPEPSELT